MGSACSLEAIREDRSQSEHLRQAHKLQFHFDVKPRNELEPSDLHAALLGDVRKASWALEQHEVGDGKGWSALHLSAAGGHQEVARMLLRKRAEVNPKGLSVSPLSLACLSGKSSVVELLICSLAKLDGPDQNGGAPLLHAAYKNRMPICQLLLDSGANPQVSFQQSNACLLAPPGRPANETAHHWQEVLHDASGIARLEDLHFCQGITALHLAAWHGNATLCTLLLDANAPPNAQDVFARTSLCFAAQRGHREATATLLARKAHSESADWIGHTAASWAAKMGQKDIVQLLLDVIHPDFVPWFGAPSMLHVAAYHRRMAVVACLLAQHANLEVTLQPGALRPLMVAAFQGSVEICQLLLSHHADVNQKDEQGTTAWQYAALSGHEKTCDLLVAFGASES